MFQKLLLSAAGVLAESKRELAGGGATAAATEFKSFGMEHTSNEGYKFHYANYGQDWNQIEGLPDSQNQCGLDVQSPVNLMLPLGSYGWAYGYPNNKMDDQWTSNYQNINDALVEWDYNKISVKFNEEDAKTMFFQSNYAQQLYGSGSKHFQPTQIVLRSPSEHTINGHHSDVEMQIYHDIVGADNETIKYAAIAILFEVEVFDEIDQDSNKTLQDFFRQFQFENHEDKVAPQFDIGDVLKVVDFEDRWAYKGAVSEPPCSQGVYWNVLGKMYPIEIERMALLKDYLYSKKGYLGSYKNNRKIQEVLSDGHKVQYIGAKYFGQFSISASVVSCILAYAIVY